MDIAGLDDLKVALDLFRTAIGAGKDAPSASYLMEGKGKLRHRHWRKLARLPRSQRQLSPKPWDTNFANARFLQFQC